MLLQSEAAESASLFATYASTMSCGAEMSNFASSRSRASIISTRTRLTRRMMPCFDGRVGASITGTAAARGGVMARTIHA